MAIDPTIALGIRPVESPLDSYGKALGVQGMQQRNTLANLGIQEQTTQLQNTKNYNDAVAASIDPATGMPDYQKVSQILAQKGSGSMIPGIMKQNVEMQAAQAKAQQEHFAVMKQKADMMGQRIGALASDPTTSKQSIVMEGQKALQDGLLDPEHYQSMIQQVQQLPDDAGAVHGFLMQQLQQNRSVSDQLDRLTPKITTQMVGGQIVPVTTTQATGQVTAGAPVTSAPTTDLAKINADEKAGLLSPADAAAARKKATYIAPSMVTMMMQQGGGGANFDASKPLPAAQEAQARAIADGAALMTPSSRNPYALPINARAQQIYADANGGDMTGFGTAHGTLTQGRKSFAAGGANSKTLVALDTAIHHFDALGKAVDALNNCDTVALNAVGNYMSKQFGDPAVTNFDTVKTLAADEFTKVAAGVTSGEGEREKMQSLFQAANSPQQLKQAIAQAQILMAGKVQGLDTAYKGAYGPTRSVMEQVSPETKSVIGKASQSVPTPGGQPATQVNPANGKTYYLHSDGKYYLTQAQ